MEGKRNKKQVKQILSEIWEMMAELLPKSEIVKRILEKHPMSRAMAYKYIEKAVEEFNDVSSMDIEKAREFAKRFVKKQLMQANGGMKVAWYDRYIALYKGSLQPDADDKKQKLEITYKKVGDE